MLKLVSLELAFQPLLPSRPRERGTRQGKAKSIRARQQTAGHARQGTRYRTRNQGLCCLSIYLFARWMVDGGWWDVKRHVVL